MLEVAMNTMKNMRTSLVLIAAALLSTTACVEQSNGDVPESTLPSDDSIEQALTSIDDSMSDDSLDEEPAFGDATFSAAFDEDDVQDPGAVDLREDPEIVRTDGEAVRIFHVMAVWGRIRPNDNEPIAMRWNPSITVADGDAVRVRRTVRFDRFDEVLEQETRNRLDIISATRPHVDGVVLQVAITAADAVDGYLQFAAGDMAFRYGVSELGNLSEQLITDSAGNGLMLVSLDRTPDDNPCASGFLAGRWINTGAPGGVFGVRWMSEDGDVVGHLAGRYADGEFRAKYIDRNGEFRGFLAGVYGDGHFTGEYYDADGNQLGVLRGQYTTNGTGHGLFRGSWSKDCSVDPIDPSVRPTEVANASTD